MAKRSRAAASPALRQPPLAGPPLDFSFKELVSLEDGLYEMAESGCAAAPPLVHVDPDNPDDTPPPPPLPPRPRARFNSVAVRLSNNRLRSLDGLREFLQHVLDSPEQLAWLDVSCNELERVDTVLQDYPNLQILYMHGNRLSKLADIKRLAALPSLRKVTLHGNPICELPVYRQFVPAHVPALRSLDFGAITHLERADVDAWARGHEARLAAH